MNSMTHLTRLLVAASLAMTAANMALADPGALDGKKFEGVFIERGKIKGEADTLIFKDGRFRSTACDAAGFSDAPYKSTPAADGIAFEAETESAKYGRLVWKGIIREGKLDATAMNLRKGKPPVENWVVGASKP